MRTDKLSVHVLIIGLVCFSLLHISTAGVYTYYGNGDGSGGGAIGNGSLTLSDSGSTVHATVALGGSSPSFFQNYLVLYIDSRPGGFTDTSRFYDNSSAFASTVSGYASFGSRATAKFAPNFGADYAIVLSRNAPTMRIYELAAGPTLPDPKSVTFTDNGSSWQFNFDLNDVGASGPYFKFQSTATSSLGTAYRYLESYETLTGTKGFDTVTFGNFNTFGVEAVPETTNAALAVFGGLVLTVGVGSRVRRYLFGKA
ncbi:MAG TPA: hypothetical protein VNZ64_17175 [Candidatus Acidoferrum sp.]|nr:hypothetical protein [Candidatus Acidoferrum sp.]